MQLSTAIANARAAAIADGVSAGPNIIQIRTGAAPANCAAADTGTLLAAIDAPNEMFDVDGSGNLVMAEGPWDGTAVAAGTVGHYRVKTNGVCVMQGPAGTTGTEMIVSVAALAVGQDVSVTQFNITEPNR